MKRNVKGDTSTLLFSPPVLSRELGRFRVWGRFLGFPVVTLLRKPGFGGIRFFPEGFIRVIEISPVAHSPVDPAPIDLAAVVQKPISSPEV